MEKYIAIRCVVEIERYSNQKWEYDRKNDVLVLDRVLKYPYFYPYAYGFIPDTLGHDGDELDILLITDKKYRNYNDVKQTIEGCIVGGLLMYDEKGRDDKIFVVPLDEIEQYERKTNKEINAMEENIQWFFSNYKNSKSKDENEEKWSRVERLLDKDEANQVYKQSVIHSPTKLSSVVHRFAVGISQDDNRI
jgi:inorganic pyrophosphatase